MATAGGQLGTTQLGEVLDGRHDQVALGREVVQLRAAGDAGALADQRGRRAGVAVLDQALDRRLEQAQPHGAGAFLLRDACGGGHPPIVEHHNKQSRLTFCDAQVRRAASGRRERAVSPTMSAVSSGNATTSPAISSHGMSRNGPEAPQVSGPLPVEEQKSELDAVNG